MAGLFDMLRGSADEQRSAPAGAPAGGIFGSMGQQQEGNGLQDFLGDVGIGLMMGDKRTQGIGQAMLLRNEKASKRKGQNQTVQWLTKQGLGQEEAAYLAGDPEALRAWYKDKRAGNEPDWQITDMYDDQGRKIKAMVDKKTGKYNQIGGAENEQTTLMQNLAAAGLQPGTEAYQNAILAGTRSGVNVDARNMGAIPQGYRVEYDENGNPVSMSPVPGGPADTTKSDAAKRENLSASTDVITGAATKARDAYNSAILPVTGTLGQIMGNFASTNSAEVRRQVETLKSNAKIENLQAMRAASPTGGALGAVSDSENVMLAAKAGALDPDSPHFARDLDDYERSLLRTIHGKEAGDLIFEKSRQNPADTAADSAPQPGSVMDGYRFKGGDPSDPNAWERAQ